ncbi:PREDICTED: acylamino-acid-releasing enzyme-like [Acropora digitifera]|uniref:acylamino-acid-releasing enzyme-like n=1 Tax=Acropora digitifera TaxID=70779 RepID=UPI00077A571D|nr:PREDICTED: acylamino-acid-releasing enzyme-like [Acropora digitifera]
MPCARVLFFLACKLSFIDPQIKAPTLFFLGADDVRVPPKQGTNFHRLLKANGVETRLLWYPGNNHPISKVDAESDVFVNLARWFFEHAQK